MTTAIPDSVSAAPSPVPAAAASVPDVVAAEFDTFFNDDAGSVPVPAPAPAAKPLEPKPEPPKEAPKLPEKAPEKPAEEEPDLDDGLTEPEAKPGEPADDDKEQEELKPVEHYTTNVKLRGAYQRARSFNEALLKSKAALKKQLAEKGAPTTSPQVEAITKELETVRARNGELENAIKGYDYTKSSEYQQKFAAPLNDAIAQAQKAVGFLKVIVPGAVQEDGTTSPATTRAATWGDFRKLYEMEPGDVDAAAVQMFGAASHRIVSHLDKIRGLGEQADEAAKNSAKLADESKQHQMAKSTEEMQRGVRLYTEAIKELSTKFPKVFGEIEGDKEANEVRSKGMAWADRAMSGEAIVPEERARRHAELRMRAGVVPLLIHQKKQLSQKLAEAEAKLKGYESSAPKRDAAIDAPKVDDEGDIMKAIDNLPRTRV